MIWLCNLDTIFIFEIIFVRFVTRNNLNIECRILNDEYRSKVPVKWTTLFHPDRIKGKINSIRQAG